MAREDDAAPPAVAMNHTAAIPDKRDLLKSFAERHHLQVTDLIEREHVVIRASASANFLITAGYAGFDETALSDPAVGILLNMLNRNFELVEAGVVFGPVRARLR